MTMDKNQRSLLETVVAKIDLPEHDIVAGDLGAVVETYESPDLAYEVEFVNPDGSTRALLTLQSDQVRAMTSSDVLTTRQITLIA